MRIIAASVFVFMLASLASAADVDWKFYGTALLAGPSGGDSLCGALRTEGGARGVGGMPSVQSNSEPL
jgi:hypothetical protein